MNILTIRGMGISKNEDGLWSLNDLHRSSGLGKDKAPNQWLRTGRATSLEEALDTKLHFCSLAVNRGGSNPSLYFM